MATDNEHPELLVTFPLPLIGPSPVELAREVYDDLVHAGWKTDGVAVTPLTRTFVGWLEPEHGSMVAAQRGDTVENMPAGATAVWTLSQ